MKMRLSTSFNCSKLARAARVVCVALQQYGTIFADNGSPYFITGEASSAWDPVLDEIQDLKKIPGSLMEVLNTGCICTNYDCSSSDCSVAPPPSSTASPPPVASPTPKSSPPPSASPKPSASPPPVASPCAALGRRAVREQRFMLPGQEEPAVVDLDIGGSEAVGSDRRQLAAAAWAQAAANLPGRQLDS